MSAKRLYKPKGGGKRKAKNPKPKGSSGGILVPELVGDDKEAARRRIKDDVKDWLAKGNQVEVIPMGRSGMDVPTGVAKGKVWKEDGEGKGGVGQIAGWSNESALTCKRTVE